MDRIIKGYPYAKAAVEMAADDLAGRQWGLPVYRLLGGAVRKRIPLAHSIGLIGFDEAEKEVAKVVAEGVKTIKIKVGEDPERYVEMVKRIRATIGPKPTICIDANQGYATPGQAIRIFRRMEACDISYLNNRSRASSASPKSRGRSIHRSWPTKAHGTAMTSCKSSAASRRTDHLDLHQQTPGGPPRYRAMEVAAVARAAGLKSDVNGSIETGAGNLANLHLSAAASAVTMRFGHAGCRRPPKHRKSQSPGIVLSRRPDRGAPVEDRRRHDRSAGRRRHGYRCR